jgi:hypothetical protein
MKKSVTRVFRALHPLALSSALTLIFSLAFFTAAAQDITLKVWPDGVPGSIIDPGYQMETTMVNGTSPRVSKVTDPTLEVWLAPAETATGLPSTMKATRWPPG